MVIHESESELGKINEIKTNSSSFHFIRWGSRLKHYFVCHFWVEPHDPTPPKL